MVNGIPTGGLNGDTWLSTALKPTDAVSCQYSDNTGCVAGAPVMSNAIMLSPGTGAPATVTIGIPASGSCAGSPITFTATPVNAGINPTYQWKVNGNNAGTDSSGFTSQTLVNGDKVTCVVTPDVLYPCATGGAASSNEVVVSLENKTAPAVSISDPPGIVCRGATLSFKATAANAGANPSYQWEINGAPAGTNSPDFTTRAANNGDIIQCMLTIDPAYFCSLTNTSLSMPVTLQVKDQADPQVKVDPKGNGACAGSPIDFSAFPENAGTDPTYQWLVNGVPQGNGSPVFGSTQLANGDLITCSMTPGTGACNLDPVLSNKVVALVHSLPLVSVSPPDTVILFDQQVTLKAVVSPDVVSYQWLPPADLVNAQMLEPLTVPLQDSVLFTLTVQTADDCKSTAEALVKVYHALAMPNAFSPNDDGVNDIFRIPPGITLQLKEFSIFDRWGNRVFSTTNIGTGWDGTVAGRRAGAGVYVYVITGKDLKGSVTAKGTVILVR
jgi:gliding motility-associated-like protein